VERELQDRDRSQMDEPLLALTEKAVEMLKQAMAQAGRKDSGIRMTVAGGGCEGFQYSLKMEVEIRPDDVVIVQDGIRALLDPVSAQRLRGTLLDYVTNRYGTGFHFFGLNRTKRDWHSDAHADRSRVVRLLQRSARSGCAANYDSGDSPGGASPHAGGITTRPVWLRLGAPFTAPVRRRADTERSGARAVLFTLERVSDRPGVPSRDTTV